MLLTIALASIVVVSVALYQIYMPYLDVVENGGKTYLVVWYYKDKKREYRIICEIPKND
jgi:hypothetical protein